MKLLMCFISCVLDAYGASIPDSGEPGGADQVGEEDEEDIDWEEG